MAAAPRANDPEYHPGQWLRWGRYRVRGLHAFGGNSAVYTVDQRLGWRRRELVALKVARPRTPDPVALVEAEIRLAREAVLLRLVSHWRLPRPIAAFREHGRANLVLEFVHGQTLESLLRDPRSGLRPPWPEGQVLALGRALAGLLDDLHTGTGGSVPILVRDLKPGNLIVTPRGDVRLVDLGIACRLSDGALVPANVRGHMTPGYAPPEQCRGEGAEDARTDLYALGAVLYRVATGWDPAHDGWTPPRPARALNRAVSPRLETLLADLLRHSPADRPPTAHDVLRRLEVWGPGAR